MPRPPRSSVTFTGKQFEAIAILLVLAIAALVCVALYSTWPRWRWKKPHHR